MDETGPTDKQAEFHRRIHDHNLAALWVARRGVDLTRPAIPAQAAHWTFDDIRPTIMEGGELVTAEDAFRRVLVLENPAFPGEQRATGTLYAGLQLVLPGELAPSHRHSQTAIRFILEGDGALTSVDGGRTHMSPGDFVITPQWTWHDHVNEGDEPVIWLDVLDTPLVGFLDTMFRETYPEAQFPVSRPDDDSPARYGTGMVPIEHEPRHGASPVFNYTYTSSRGALETLVNAGAPDPCYGYKMAYIDPSNGQPPTPTMSAYLQWLPAGFKGEGYRSTDAAIYSVAEGSGRAVIGDQIFSWSARDVFVVPGWMPYRLEANSDTVLFSVSDRATQAALGLWREERLINP